MFYAKSSIICEDNAVESRLETVDEDLDGFTLSADYIASTLSRSEEDHDSDDWFTKALRVKDSARRRTSENSRRASDSNKKLRAPSNYHIDHIVNDRRFDETKNVNEVKDTRNNKQSRKYRDRRSGRTLTNYFSWSIPQLLRAADMSRTDNTPHDLFAFWAALLAEIDVHRPTVRNESFTKKIRSFLSRGSPFKLYDYRKPRYSLMLSTVKVEFPTLNHMPSCFQVDQLGYRHVDVYAVGQDDGSSELKTQPVSTTPSYCSSNVSTDCSDEEDEVIVFNVTKKTLPAVPQSFTGLSEFSNMCTTVRSAVPNVSASVDDMSSGVRRIGDLIENFFARISSSFTDMAGRVSGCASSYTFPTDLWERFRSFLVDLFSSVCQGFETFYHYVAGAHIVPQWFRNGAQALYDFLRNLWFRSFNVHDTNSTGREEENHKAQEMKNLSTPPLDDVNGGSSNSTAPLQGQAQGAGESVEMCATAFTVLLVSGFFILFSKNDLSFNSIALLARNITFTVAGTKVFFEHVFPVIKKFITATYERFTGHPLLYESPSEFVDGYTNWYREVTEVITCPAVAETISTDPVSQVRYRAIHKDGIQYSRMFALARDPHVRTQLTVHNNLLNHLSRVMQEKSVNFAHMDTNTAPVILHLWGKPGVGKTGCISYLAQQLVSRFQLFGHQDKHVFVRNAYDQYWDGYHGQFITFIDDFGQLGDVAGSGAQNNPEYLDLLNVATPFSYKLKMANLTEKQDTYFTSDFCLLTAQKELPTVLSFSDPNSINRRLEYSFEVTVVDECKTKQDRLDVNKIRDDMTHLRFRLTDANKDTGKTRFVRERYGSRVNNLTIVDIVDILVQAKCQRIMVDNTLKSRPPSRPPLPVSTDSNFTKHNVSQVLNPIFGPASKKVELLRDIAFDDGKRKKFFDPSHDFFNYTTVHAEEPQFHDALDTHPDKAEEIPESNVDRNSESSKLTSTRPLNNSDEQLWERLTNYVSKSAASRSDVPLLHELSEEQRDNYNLRVVLQNGGRVSWSSFLPPIETHTNAPFFDRVISKWGRSIKFSFAVGKSNSQRVKRFIISLLVDDLSIFIGHDDRLANVDAIPPNRHVYVDDKNNVITVCVPDLADKSYRNLAILFLWTLRVHDESPCFAHIEPFKDGLQPEKKDLVNIFTPWLEARGWDKAPLIYRLFGLVALCSAAVPVALFVSRLYHAWGSKKTVEAVSQVDSSSDVDSRYYKERVRDGRPVQHITARPNIADIVRKIKDDEDGKRHSKKKTGSISTSKARPQSGEPDKDVGAYHENALAFFDNLWPSQWQKEPEKTKKHIKELAQEANIHPAVLPRVHHVATNMFSFVASNSENLSSVSYLSSALCYGGSDFLVVSHARKRFKDFEFLGFISLHNPSLRIVVKQSQVLMKQIVSRATGMLRDILILRVPAQRHVLAKSLSAMVPPSTLRVPITFKGIFAGLVVKPHTPMVILGLQNPVYSMIHNNPTPVQYVSEGNPHLLSDGFYTDYPTEAGDCATALLCDNPEERHILRGFHVARAGANAYSEPLYRDEIETALDTFASPQIAFNLPVLPLKRTMSTIQFGSKVYPPSARHIPQGEFVYHGVFADSVEPVKSNVVPSLINGWHGDCVCGPANIPRDPGLLAAKKQEVLAKAGAAPGRVDNDILRSARLSFREKLHSSSRISREQRRLTIQEACYGIDGDPLVKGLDLSTAPGFYWDSCVEAGKKGKTTWVPERTTTDIPEISPKLLEAVVKLMYLLGKNILPACVCKDSLKDECRLHGKRERPRIFSVLPLHWLIVFRIMFGDYAAWIMANHVFNEIGIGINPQSSSWHVLALHICNMNSEHRGIDGDYSNYDGTLIPEVCLSFAEEVNLWYGDTDNQWANIRRNLMHCLVNAFHTYDGKLYQWTHGQPSGNFLTTLLNSYHNNIVIRCAFIAKLSENGTPILTGHKLFNKNVWMISFGDDNIVVPNDATLRWFTQRVISEQMNKLGLKYTTADKKTEFADSYPIAELSFLKRKFKFDEELSQFVGPLDKTSIEEMMCFYKSKQDRIELTKEQLDSFFLHAWLHGKQYYNDSYDVLRVKLRKVDMWPSTYVHKTYEEQFSSYLL